MVETRGHAHDGVGEEELAVPVEEGGAGEVAACADGGYGGEGGEWGVRGGEEGAVVGGVVGALEPEGRGVSWVRERGGGGGGGFVYGGDGWRGRGKGEGR